MAEESKRLIDINTASPIEVDYIFQKEYCFEKILNPFDNPNSFYRCDKSSSNSQKYQCKLCKKIKNITRVERIFYLLSLPILPEALGVNVADVCDEVIALTWGELIDVLSINGNF